ncbi:hypothetical protein Tco_0837553 [Tanacetum coccineum]
MRILMTFQLITISLDLPSGDKELSQGEQVMKHRQSLVPILIGSRGLLVSETIRKLRALPQLSSITPVSNS